MRADAAPDANLAATAASDMRAAPLILAVMGPAGAILLRRLKDLVLVVGVEGLCCNRV